MEGNLSEKVTDQCDERIGSCYVEEDVKQALEEFIDWCMNKAYQGILDRKHPLGFKAKAEEIFGGRLV